MVACPICNCIMIAEENEYVECSSCGTRLRKECAEEIFQQRKRMYANRNSQQFNELGLA